MGGTISKRFDNDIERVVIVSKELTFNLMRLLGYTYNGRDNNDRLKNLIIEAKSKFDSDIINDIFDLLKCKSILLNHILFISPFHLTLNEKTLFLFIFYKVRNKIVHEHNYNNLNENRYEFDIAYIRVSAAIKQVSTKMDQLDNRNGEDIHFVVVSYKIAEENLRQVMKPPSNENGWTLIENAKNVLSSKSRQALIAMNTCTYYHAKVVIIATHRFIFFHKSHYHHMSF